MILDIESVALLLLIASVVAILARRFKIPYSAGLVIAGGIIALLPFAPDWPLTKELVFTAFLPPLIFEAALFIDWSELRKDLPVILLLATVGVLLSAAVTALGMWSLVGWPLASAAVFGVLIAATDPVSVIATFKDAGVRGRLRLLVEAESLLNDGVAAAVFAIALSVAGGASVGWLEIAQLTAATVIGGLVCGALIAGGVLLLAGRTEDHLVEITLTTIAAYGSFLLAEHFHFSGVLATLTAGLIVGNVGPLGHLSKKGREALVSFWEYAAFVANSLIFILIGIREAHQNFAPVLAAIGIAIVVVLVGRALAVYPLCLLFARSSRRVTAKHQHVLFWGGLRGALALALALSLPPDLPFRDAIVTVAFGVVAFSILVQGLTMTPLLRRMGEIH